MLRVYSTYAFEVYTFFLGLTFLCTVLVPIRSSNFRYLAIIAKYCKTPRFCLYFRHLSYNKLLGDATGVTVSWIFFKAPLF